VRAVPERPLRPDGAPSSPGLDAFGRHPVHDGEQVPPRGGAEHGAQGDVGQGGDVAGGEQPVPAQLGRGHGAHAPELLDGQGVEERVLEVGLDEQQAVRLGDAARDLGEERRPCDADRDGQPDVVAHLGA
jgi:hypothetical protein